MDRRPLRRLTHKPILRSEDLSSAVSSVQDAMKAVRSDFTAQTRAARRSTRPLPQLPDMSEATERALREFLEDEITELEPVQEGEIEEGEIRRELMKKALVGLKMPVLRSLASRRGIAAEGRSETLAERVASSYEWDEAAIAQLILDHTAEPADTDNGPSTRVYLLREEVNLAQFERTLEYVVGRYVRTGPARWFVFEDYRRINASTLELQGSLRTYRPRIDEGEEVSLSADRTINRARLRIEEGSIFAYVEGATSAGVSRAMMSAVARVTEWQFLPYIPNAETGAQSLPGSLHPITLFVLDIVTSKLRGNLFRQRNPILARFRLAKDDAGAHREGSGQRRPRLSAVRFEGEYLLDSPAACRLMWTDGRPLVDLTLRVSVTEPADTVIRGTFPLRLAVESDHVLVATGLGNGNSRLATEVHRAAVAAVRSQITNGTHESRADVLRDSIRMQAQSTHEPEEATLLSDDLEKI